MSVYSTLQENDTTAEHLSKETASFSGEGIAILNTSNQITFCNEVFLQITGKTIRETYNLLITDVFPSLLNYTDSYVATGKQKFLYQDTILLEITFSNLLDETGNHTGTAVIIKKTISAVPVTEFIPVDKAPLQPILEAIPNLAWTARPDGSVNYVNHRWSDYTGLRVTELLEWGWRSFFHPEDINQVSQCWNRAIQTGEKYECEFRFKKEPEAIYRWMLGQALPIRDEQGRITLWVGTSTDIHNQKLTEEALEQRIAERTNELSIVIEERNRISERLSQEIETKKLLDTALQDRKSFIDKVTDLVPCLISVYNIHSGQYIYINKALESMFGYSTDEVLRQGAPLLLSLIHPDDRESLMKKNAEALQQANWQPDITVDFEYRILHKNGSWRWIHTSGIAFDRDSDGNVVHVLNISIDITDKNEATAKINDSKRLIEQIARTTPDLLYIFDITTHKNLYANRRMEQVLGYTQAQMHEMGKKLFPLIMHPDDLAGFPENVRRLNELEDGEVFENELKLKDVDGKWRWFCCREIAFSRNADGVVTQILGSAQDITEKKEAEFRIWEKQHFIERIANTIPNVIYIYDINKQQNIYANREIHKLLGYSPEQVKKMGTAFLSSVVHADDFPKLLAVMQTLSAAKDDDVISVEYRIQHSNGNWLWFYDRSTVFTRKPDGTVQEVLGFSQDITEKKIAENELREKNKIIDAILHKLPVIVTRIDKNGTILEAIGSGLHNLGLVDNQIQGVNVFKSYSQVAPYVQQALEGKSVTFIGMPQRDSGMRYFLNNYFFDKEKESAIGFSIDITEQKLAEEKLKESELRLKQLNEELEKRVQERTKDLAISQERYEIASYVTHDAIWDWNLLTNMLTYSKGYYSIFGYDPAETSDMIEEWYNRIHPEDRTRTLQSIHQVIDSGKQLWTEEYRHLRKNGSYAYVLDRGYVQHDANGKAFRMVGAMADITEAKLAGEAIRKSEAKFRHIFESDMLGIFIWAKDGRIVEANNKFLNIVGYSHTDLEEGRLNWKQMTPEEYTNKDQLAIEELLINSPHSPLEKEYIRKDGSRVPVMIGGVLLMAHENQGVAFVLDNARHKKAQQELTLSEERFRLVTQATNDAVRDWNIETDILWWNDGFKKMFGYQLNEIEPGLESWYSRIHPDEMEKVLQHISNMIEYRQENWSGEYRFRRADGSYAYILDRTYVIYNGRGKAKRMLGSMVDVSYLKQIQDALEQQTAELKQSNTDLEQFAYISSHDLQEPLNTAASFARLLEKRYKDKLDDDGKEFIHFIVNSTDRMKLLIRSVLDYSKINSVAKSFEQTDIKQLAITAIDNLKVIVGQNHANIHVNHLPVLPVIPSQIIQLFQNLFSNAIKFRSEANPEIIVSATEQATHFLFSIQDNGIGMDMNYADKIFQVFQRLHSRDEYEGAGVGLAICKRILDRHNGNIWVESSPNTGSVFYFTLKK